MNDWIRTTDAFDAVFDVARAVENPDAPDHIHPDLDGGDGMHLNDKGAQAMADAVDLETLVLGKHSPLVVPRGRRSVTSQGVEVGVTVGLAVASYFIWATTSGGIGPWASIASSTAPGE